MYSSKIQVGVYGPSKSGKTSFIERIIFPEGIYKDPYPGNVAAIPITSESELFFLTEYPDGHLPSEQDSIDRIVVLVNRKQDKWKPYLDEAMKISERVYPVYSIIDSRNYDGRFVMTGSYKVSSKTGVGFKSLCIDLYRGDNRITTNTNKRKIVYDDGWVVTKANTKKKGISLTEINISDVSYNPFDILS